MIRFLVHTFEPSQSSNNLQQSHLQQSDSHTRSEQVLSADRDAQRSHSELGLRLVLAVAVAVIIVIVLVIMRVLIIVSMAVSASRRHLSQPGGQSGGGWPAVGAGSSWV